MTVYRFSSLLPQYEGKTITYHSALTNITPSKVKFKWTKIKQYAFDEIKRIVPAILYYPIQILMKHLIFTPMLVVSKYEQLSYRKLNISISMVEKSLMPRKVIQ